MKYTATINLAGIHDAGLSDKTDLADWVIIEYIFEWYAVTTATRRGDKVWINFRHMIEEIPILGIKSKSAISARLKKLAGLGLLNIDHDEEGRIFASIGRRAIETRCFRADRSSNEPTVREKERPVLPEERPVREKEHRPVLQNEHSLDNQFLSGNQSGNQDPNPKSCSDRKTAAAPAPDPGTGLALVNGSKEVATTTLNGKIKAEAKTGAIWAAYSAAYFKRYGAEPVRNAKINGQLAQIIDRLGADEAPHVAACYVGSSNAFYVARRHSVDCLLRDCESLRTEWATGTRMSATEARHMDEHQTSAENAKWLRENMDNLRAARREGKI